MYLNIIGKAKNIEYDVTEEDLDLEEGLSQKEINKAIKNAKASLAKELGKELDFYLILGDEDIDVFEIDDPEDIDFSDSELQDFISELVADYISDETGYCIDGFEIDWDSCRGELPTYQVVAFGYDKDNEIVDDILICEELDKTKAIKVAKSIEKVDDAFLMRRRKNKIAYVNIEVETVLRDGPVSTINMDTIWTDSIEAA